MYNWQSMDSAPRDGTQILCAYNNDCSWDYRVVWWSKSDTDYPWQDNSGNEWPEGRVDYWTTLEPPYLIEESY